MGSKYQLCDIKLRTNGEHWYTSCIYPNKHTVMKSFYSFLAIASLFITMNSCNLEPASCVLSDFSMKGDYCEISVENTSGFSTAFDTRCTIDLYIGDEASDRTTVGLGDLRPNKEVDGIGYFISSEYDKAEIMVSWADEEGEYHSKSYTRK